ncbi:hypothetical protein ACNKHM_06940 [Shigella sonnei]
MTLAQWFEERELRRELGREVEGNGERDKEKGIQQGRQEVVENSPCVFVSKGMPREDVAEMANLPSC